MHVPDGFLSPAITVPAYALSAPLWVYATRRYFGSAAVERLPLMGSLTALAFVIQSIMIPVPGGTSTHIIGATLLALLYNPLVAFVCETLVLLVQALFFGAGGITVLAVNAITLGLVGPSLGWAVFRALRPLREHPAAFAAGYIAVQTSALGAAAVLGLQQAMAPDYLSLSPVAVLAAMMLPSLTVTGAVEGLYTASVLGLVNNSRLAHGL